MRRVAVVAVVAGLTVATAVLVWELREILLLFLLAVVTGAAVRPLVNGCATRGIPRKWALAVTYAGISLFLAVVMVVVGGSLVDELAHLAGRVTLGYPAMLARWRAGGVVASGLAAALPAPESLSGALRSLRPDEVAEGALVATKVVLRGAGGAVVVLALSAYWIAHRKTFERLALSFVPAARRAHVRAVTEALERDVGRHVLAEVLGALLAVLGSALAFHALALPYPTLPAAFAGIARLVPVAGPALAAVVAAGAAGASGAGAGALALALAAAATTIALLRIVDRVVVRRLLATPAPSPLLAVLAVVLLTSSGIWWALPIASPLALALQIAARRAARARRSEWNRDASLREQLGWVCRRQAELEQQLGRWRASHTGAPHLVALGARLSGIVRELRELVSTEAAESERAA